MIKSILASLFLAHTLLGCAVASQEPIPEPGRFTPAFQGCPSYIRTTNVPDSVDEPIDGDSQWIRIHFSSEAQVSDVTMYAAQGVAIPFMFDQDSIPLSFDILGDSERLSWSAQFNESSQNFHLHDIHVHALTIISDHAPSAAGQLFGLVVECYPQENK